MFKGFKCFKNLRTRIETKLSSPKAMKAKNCICKIAKAVCIGSAFITAFNLGNIVESLHHVTGSAVGVKELVGWLYAMIKTWIVDIKSGDFSWGIKQILIPMGITVTWIGSKIASGISKLIGFFSKKNKKVEEPVEEVVNVFA